MKAIKINKQALQAKRKAERKVIIRQGIADAIAFAGMVTLFTVLYVVTPN